MITLEIDIKQVKTLYSLIKKELSYIEDNIFRLEHLSRQEDLEKQSLKDYIQNQKNELQYLNELKSKLE